MKIEKLVERCFEHGIYPILDKISIDPVPAAIVALGPPEAVAIVANDGSAVIVEHGLISPDFGFFELVCPANVLAATAAAPEIEDLTPTLTAGANIEVFPTILAKNKIPTLAYLNHAARVHLVGDPDAPIRDVRDLAVIQGYDVTPLITQIFKISDTLQDPFFIPVDQKNFTQQEADRARDLLGDALLIDPLLRVGKYTLRSSCPENGIASALIDEDGASQEAALNILRKLLDFQNTYTGIKYTKSNLGATRVSDFDPCGAEIATVSIQTPPSRHQRIAAWERINHAMVTKGQTKSR